MHSVGKRSPTADVAGEVQGSYCATLLFFCLSFFLGFGAGVFNFGVDPPPRGMVGTSAYFASNFSFL
jgi:hypothetical protein